MAFTYISPEAKTHDIELSFGNFKLREAKASKLLIQTRIKHMVLDMENGKEVNAEKYVKAITEFLTVFIGDEDNNDIGNPSVLAADISSKDLWKIFTTLSAIRDGIDPNSPIEEGGTGGPEKKA